VIQFLYAIYPNESREMLGVGSIINPEHEGPTKRPTESRAKLDEWSPKTSKTPEDLRREREEREKNSLY
jgi:hypothetical protein